MRSVYPLRVSAFDAALVAAALEDAFPRYQGVWMESGSAVDWFNQVSTLGDRRVAAVAISD